MVIVRLDRIGTTWTTTTSTRDAWSMGYFPTAIVGGPHGELAIIGSYTALYDDTLNNAPRSSFIQTFYP
jgi:hypothetical protein